MWVVFKYKKNNYEILKGELKNRLGRFVEFYNPKIIHKFISKNKYKTNEKNLLGNYAFCFFNEFNDKKIISRLNYIKGLDYFLNGYFEQQKEIVKFINYCKSHENDYGGISSTFFSKLNFNKGKFLSGPFANLIFEIIEKKKKNLKVALGGMRAIISKKKLDLYSPIF